MYSRPAVGRGGRCYPSRYVLSINRSNKKPARFGQSPGPIRKAGGRSGIEPGKPCTPRRQLAWLQKTDEVVGQRNSAALSIELPLARVGVEPTTCGSHVLRTGSRS